jgi:energy-coupling factor transporter transmembrane protein EcfT
VSRALKRTVRPRLETEQGKGSACNSDWITAAGKPSLSHRINFRTITLFFVYNIMYILIIKDIYECVGGVSFLCFIDIEVKLMLKYFFIMCYQIITNFLFD